MQLTHFPAYRFLLAARCSLSEEFTSETEAESLKPTVLAVSACWSLLYIFQPGAKLTFVIFLEDSLISENRLFIRLCVSSLAVKERKGKVRNIINNNRE